MNERIAYRVVFGVRGDDGIKELLDEPSVIEKFNNSAAKRGTKSTNQVSPLVQQAGAFALYLNPPKPPAPRPEAGRGPSYKRSPSAKPKFTVLATSYHKDRPDLSIAMIDEPGKGRNWVRQSSMVGHLLVVEIKDGSVVLKDSSGTFELAAEQKPQISLLAGAPGISSKAAGISSSKVSKTGSSKPSGVNTARSSAYSGRTVSPTPKLPKKPLPRKTNQQSKIMAELAEKLTQMQKRWKSGELNAQEKAAMMNQLISEVQASKSSQLSAEESERLSILGKELRKMMEEPTGSSKK